MKSKPMKIWTEEEVEILRNNENKFLSEIYSYFPYRTKISVSEKIRLLNLNYKNDIFKYVKEGELFKCIECGNEKTYNNDNFIIKSSNYMCRECIKKYSNIGKYKRKYGIILDSDKMFDTFSPIQWYEIYFQNKIEIMPMEILQSKEKYKEIVKYVIEEKIGFKDKSQLVNLRSNTLKQYKIHMFQCKKLFNINNFNELIIYLYPQYNINGFDFVQVSSNYWNDIEHVDKYMKYYVNNIVGGSQCLKQNVSKYFKYDYLRGNKYNQLISCIHLYKHYNSFYEWLIKLYPKSKLEPKDFNIFIGCDNKTYCDSYEEKIVFDYIYSNLGIKTIKEIGKKRKNKFYNSKYNENYFPDFIIEDNQLNKPIIIEYYGLVRKQSSDCKYIEDYKNKVQRKNEYYKSREDIYFIDLYPNDLKGNCEGVKSKITSFFIAHNISFGVHRW